MVPSMVTLLSGTIQQSLRPFQRLRSCQTSGLKCFVNVTCSYTKWTSRKPVAIVNEDELFGSNEIKPEKSVRPRKIPIKKQTQDVREVEDKKYFVTDKNKACNFTALKDDRIITSLMTQIKGRKKREKNDKVILEGHRLIHDGIEAGAEPQVIIFSRISDVQRLSLPEGVQLYKVPYRTIQLWSNLTTSPGLIGIFKTPEVQNKEAAEDALPLTIICDNVREPGNLGSILRVAAGVGCEKLILMKGCVDLWDSKVLRSAAGAHFRVPISTSQLWEDIPSLISQYSKIFMADSNFICDPQSSSFPKNLKHDAGTVDTETRFEDSELDETVKATVVESEHRKEKEIMKELLLTLPIVPYYSLDYTNNETVLIISGETEGLSFGSYEFLKERNTVRVNIPLSNNVDSLNTGTATGIVLFEIKRQFLQKQHEIE